jgi:hypothetical protein
MTDDTKLQYGMFSMTEIWLKGRNEAWNDLLDIHDTHGVPLDLIYLKVKEGTDYIPEDWTSDNFIEFMGLYRKERSQREFLNGRH